jgi:predicted Zn-dependent protease
MRLRRGRWRAVVLTSIVIGGLLWCGWRRWDVRQYRDAMARVEDAMRTGRYAVAARDLAALLNRRPVADQAAYLLGLCEKARGRAQEADAAWARVSPDSPFSGQAVAARMDLLIEQGRLAAAEDFIGSAAIQARGTEGSGLRMLLIPTFMQEGRADEAMRLIESRWRNLESRGDGASEQAVNLARLCMELRWNVPPVDAVRGYLDQVGRLAPDDDRIWLGRANLAIRTGAYDEAARWIDACLGRRPDDRSVWRARLDWAMKTNRLAEARVALEHLRGEPPSLADLHRLLARHESACGDGQAERRELTAVVAEAPEDFEALDRLEELQRRESPDMIAGEWRRRRAEIESAQARYRELYRRHQPSRDAGELGRLAERLGRRFEAIVFLTAALAEEPDRDELREALRRVEDASRQSAEAARIVFDRLPTDCRVQGTSSGDESVR